MATARNHSCTHLLHAALRSVLGTHVKQAGSLVNSQRLRFDFSHIAALTPEELAAVERQVNRAIMADYPVCTKEMKHDAAVASGAMALFNENTATPCAWSAWATTPIPNPWNCAAAPT